MLLERRVQRELNGEIGEEGGRMRGAENWVVMSGELEPAGGQGGERPTPQSRRARWCDGVDGVGMEAREQRKEALEPREVP